jgi:DME family drug/metabolite transporter
MVALAAASWGTWSLFLRPAGLPPSVTMPIVFAVMAIVGVPFALREPPGKWDRTTWLLLLANAAADGLNIVTFFGAMAHTTIAIAVLTHYATPVLVALAAPYVDRVSSPGAKPAAFVALVGLVVILEPWRAPADGALIGAALGFASACCYASNVFLVRRLTVRIGGAKAMSAHSVIAAAVAAPFAASQFGAVTGTQLAYLGAGAATIGAISGIVFARGLVRIGSARASVLTFAEPVVAVALGALVWDERLRPLAAVGGALILGAGIHVARKAS